MQRISNSDKGIFNKINKNLFDYLINFMNIPELFIIINLNKSIRRYTLTKPIFIIYLKFVNFKFDKKIKSLQEFFQKAWNKFENTIKSSLDLQEEIYIRIVFTSLFKSTEFTISHHGILEKFRGKSSNSLLIKHSLNYFHQQYAYFIKSYLPQLKFNKFLKSLSVQIKLGKEEIKAISHLIQGNNTLKILSITNAGITGNKIKFLAEAIEHNKFLKMLDLSLNNIGNQGAKYLADAIEINKVLRSINLSNNRITSEGVREIANSMKFNENIEELNLSDNLIGLIGAKYMADLIKVNIIMERLFIKNSHIGDAGAIALAEAMKQNPSLEELKIYPNDFGDEGVKALNDVLKLTQNLLLH